MKAGGAAYSLIKKYEGYCAESYNCPAGVPTVGWGHTKGVHLGMKVTTDEAERMLAADVHDAEEAVNRLVHVSLTQGQFDALVSFVFNLGPGAFQKSTLRRLINSGGFASAALEFRRWVRAGSSVLPGLVKRRKEEAELFSKEE